VKSHISVAGLELTTATGKVESTFDDICVERMRAAGAIIVGTSTMMGAGGGARSDPKNPGVFKPFNWEAEGAQPVGSHEGARLARRISSGPARAARPAPRPGCSR
jgi:Asp-tRNA(Asn)/Glu-tRNA(Gln) amidotransferase A subunit family amidase